MEDVLDLYAQPYDSAFPVVCFDERPCQLIADVMTPLPLKPGQPYRLDYEYERQGTANLFGLLEPKTGSRWFRVTERRTKADFAACMREVVELLSPKAVRIHIVLDNLSTHSKGALYEVFPAEVAHRLSRTLAFHFTPKHGSWLNAVELEFAVIGKQCLNRRIPSVEALREEVAAWSERRNRMGQGVDWRFTTQAARTKLSRLYPSTSPDQS